MSTPIGDVAAWVATVGYIVFCVWYIHRLEKRVQKAQAEAETAQADANRTAQMLGQAWQRENCQAATIAELRRRLEKAERAAPGCGALTVTVVEKHTGLKPLDLVTGEKVLN